jgi:vancomycin resistance protein YoaR
MTKVDIDPRILIAGGMITVVLWAIPIVLGRVDGRVTARGFRNGSIIAAGLFLVTTALVAIFFYGGGMCSSVTTMFNAAVRSGLEIIERHPHSLYISRYPVGLDATVWGTPRRGQDLVFRNDTANPIQIKSYVLKRRVYFEVWGVNDGRTVTFTDPVVTDLVEAQMYYEYTDDLAAGRRHKVNDPYNSFTAVVTRTVTDVSGNVIHSDTFHSKYKLLNGLAMVGRYPGDPPAGTLVLASEYPH